MKLSLKYAFVVTALILAVSLLLIVVLSILGENIVRNVALTSFRSEVKALAKTKNYSALFEEAPDIGYYYVLDANGVVLYHSDKARVGVSVKELVPDLFRKMVEERTGIYVYDFEGVTRYVAFAFDGENYLAHAATEDELLAEVRRFRRVIGTVLVPVLVLISLGVGYVASEVLVKTPKKQVESSYTLFNTITESVLTLSNSSAEIRSLAENTELSSQDLDKSVEEFAAYLEESRAEIESTLSRIKVFTDTIEEITRSSSQLTELIETLSQLAEKITEVSDNITVLAINASIETSKQNIDREGLSRIAEMIMDLSNSTRNLAKESKASLAEVEKVVTSTVLTAEKVSKELFSVRESLNAIGHITEASTKNVDNLTKVSKVSHESIEQLYAGIEQLEGAIANIRNEVERYMDSIKKIKI